MALVIYRSAVKTHYIEINTPEATGVPKSRRSPLWDPNIKYGPGVTSEPKIAGGGAQEPQSGLKGFVAEGVKEAFHMYPTTNWTGVPPDCTYS